MKNKTVGISLIKEYLREQWRLFGMAAIWLGIFFLMFSLTEVPFRYIWYPTLLCAVIFLSYTIFDFGKFIRRHHELERLKQHIEVTLDNLPEPESMVERDYQELLKELTLRKNNEIKRIGTSKKETMEYMTLWTHQIKTPLTALQLIGDEMEEPIRTEIMTHLFEIEQYGDMMLQYIRLEGSSTDYVWKEYSIKSMINQAVKYFARIFISKGITVKVEISEEIKMVTDEKWMVFVLKQLISNALKYTKQGSIIISLQDENLVIEDAGIGIASEDLPRIFERGYTGYNGRKDKKATGLGLFLVKRILKQLHVDIEIASQINKGTRVALHIKVKQP